MMYWIILIVLAALIAVTIIVTIVTIVKERKEYRHYELDEAYGGESDDYDDDDYDDRPPVRKKKQAVGQPPKTPAAGEMCIRDSILKEEMRKSYERRKLHFL